MESQDECTKVLTQVYEFLDNELDTASGDAIREHLAACEPCMDRFDVEQAVKALVHRCAATTGRRKRSAPRSCCRSPRSAARRSSPDQTTNPR